jgi:hypothetical protein
MSLQVQSRMRFAASAVAVRTALYIVLTAAILGSSACAAGTSASPAAPSPAVATPAAGALTLTIGVYARASEKPIEGALVRHHATGGYTNALGELSISVEAGRETTVEASARGYHAMTASAVMNSDEHWKFFLEPDPPR